MINFLSFGHKGQHGKDGRDVCLGRSHKISEILEGHLHHMPHLGESFLIRTNKFHGPVVSKATNLSQDGRLARDVGPQSGDLMWTKLKK